jgi:hypothetical protein
LRVDVRALSHAVLIPRIKGAGLRRSILGPLHALLRLGRRFQRHGYEQYGG